MCGAGRVERARSRYATESWLCDRPMSCRPACRGDALLNAGMSPRPAPSGGVEVEKLRPIPAGMVGACTGGGASPVAFLIVVRVSCASADQSEAGGDDRGAARREGEHQAQ